MPDEARDNQTTEHVKKNIIGILDGIRTWVNLYLTTSLLFLLAAITSWGGILNKQQDYKPIEILGMEIHSHYFSFLYGVLFLIFISVLYFRLNLLKITFERLGNGFQKQNDSELVTLYPWIASPFHQSRRAAVTFWVFIGAGLLYLLWLASWHYAGLGFDELPEDVIDLCIYRYFIGSVDIVAFLVGCVCTFFIAKGIRAIRLHLDYP